RPPPEIRIFFATRSALSSTTTRRPRFPASIAHINPVAPPPKITTSNRRLTKPNHPPQFRSPTTLHLTLHCRFWTFPQSRLEQLRQIISKKNTSGWTNPSTTRPLTPQNSTRSSTTSDISSLPTGDTGASLGYRGHE